MSKFLKILNLLLKAHFFFKIPEEKKIIIFDEQSEIYISNLFNKKEFITHKRIRPTGYTVGRLNPFEPDEDPFNQEEPF